MNHQLNTPADAAPLGVQTFQPQAGTMNAFDPMARAAAVAPMYSMTYLNGIKELARTAVNSKLYGELNEGQATMILQTGLEMGIHPTVALRNIGSFKGKTTISSQLMLALAKAAGYQEEILENTAEAATVQLSKPGRSPYKVRFTIEDAKKAGLLDRNALYKTMPAVMLLNRAIGFAVRYGAPEVGAGLYTPEEAMDIPEEGKSRGNPPEDSEQPGTWSLEDQESLADLLEEVYAILKAAKREKQYGAQAESWNKRKNAGEPAEAVLSELKEFVEKLKGAGTQTKADAAPAEVVLPTGWTLEQSEAFNKVLAEIKGAFETLKFGDRFQDYEAKQVGYQKANTNAAPLLAKLGTELEKLQERVNKLNPPPVAETLPVDDLPVMEGEIVDGPFSEPSAATPGEEGFALQAGAEDVDAAQGIPAEELNDVMGLYWTRIQEVMAKNGDKPQKISQTKAKLLSTWTVGIRPDDTEAFERAVVRGQMAWVEEHA